MQKEIEILKEFVKQKGFRYTPQREEILKAFLSVEKHLSAEELYGMLKKKNPDIGYTTVYRTLKLLEEAGLSNEVDFGDGVSRFEHKYEHKHHDHLICVECGNCVEVLDARIEKLQDALAKKNSFIPMKHELQIYGKCRKCSQKGKR